MQYSIGHACSANQLLCKPGMPALYSIVGRQSSLAACADGLRIGAAQVNCKDRRGLLADVISALKSFPLEVRHHACSADVK